MKIGNTQPLAMQRCVWIIPVYGNKYNMADEISQLAHTHKLLV